MVTTLASYRLMSSNMPRQLSIAAKDPQVARDTEYYRTHIGGVTTVDEFIDDHRLFTYAMKAYGLEDMAFAKAFMKKVLESDLDDDQSFVNKLADKRYLEFAKAFKFLPDGGVDIGATTAQDDANEDAMIGLYSQQRITKGEDVAREAAYYKSRIGSVTSVDQLLSDQRLFDYALKAYGLDPSVASVSAIRNVLTSDLSDPNSVANKYGTSYLKLATAFSFQTDGSVAAGGSAQTSLQTNQTMLVYYEETGTDQSPAAAAFKTSYFNEAMASITNVDDLVNDNFLRGYVATAAGLSPTTTAPATIREILVSNLSDPDSAANQSAALKAVAEAFNFNTDGSLDTGVAAQDAAQSKALNNLFLTNYDDAVIATEASKTQYYRLNIGNVDHVDQLLSNSALYQYVLTSYGIDPSEVTKLDIKRALLSDPTSPSSYSSLKGDPRITALAKAFNFDSDGYTLGARLVQTDNAQTNTVTRYTATLGDLQGDQDRGSVETIYFKEKTASITTIDELLKDARLKTYIIAAYGLPSETTNDTLRKILTSDRFDQNSFVNKSDNATYQAIAADFNFDSDGTARRSDVGVAQDRDQILATQDLYLHQTLEQKAGEDSEGVRLALYFDRKASGINTAYDILADKALLQVITTSFGLPQMSLLDVDVQAKLITDRLDLADLKDPEKLKQFLTRFSAKWDVDNASASETSPAVMLLTQQSQVGVGIDLLTSLQNLKLGGA